MTFKNLPKLARYICLILLLLMPAGSVAADNPNQETAAQYCSNYGDFQSPCVAGFNGFDKSHQTENDSCKIYSGQALSACTAGWGQAAQKDPALACTGDKQNQCDLILRYVNPIINVLSISFGLIAAASIIIGAIQFSASEGDPQRAGAAKSRITNTIIAIFAYLFLYAFLQFIVPGGVFNRGTGG